MTAAQIPDSTIVGQFPSSAGGGHFGLVLSKDSPLTSCLDTAIAALKANGTLAQIQTTWLSNKANAPILK
jgi:polar amino acid transport system substrate-binding protein